MSKNRKPTLVANKQVFRKLERLGRLAYSMWKATNSPKWFNEYLDALTLAAFMYGVKNLHFDIPIFTGA